MMKETRTFNDNYDTMDDIQLKTELARRFSEGQRQNMNFEKISERKTIIGILRAKDLMQPQKMDLRMPDGVNIRKNASPAQPDAAAYEKADRQIAKIRPDVLAQKAEQDGVSVEKYTQTLREHFARIL